MGIAKIERLYHRKQINHLFSHGKALKLYPLKLIYCENIYEQSVPLKVLVSVPKRNFKHATDRNLLKRRLRESFRQLKNSCVIQPTPQAVGFIFIGKKTCNFQDIYASMKTLLTQYQKCLSNQ